MNTTDRMQIAANITIQRKKAGFKRQKDVAKVLGISLPTYRRYETEPDLLPLAKLNELAEVFGCEPGAFFKA